MTCGGAPARTGSASNPAGSRDRPAGRRTRRGEQGHPFSDAPSAPRFSADRFERDRPPRIVYAPEPSFADEAVARPAPKMCPARPGNESECARRPALTVERVSCRGAAATGRPARPFPTGLGGPLDARASPLPTSLLRSAGLLSFVYVVRLRMPAGPGRVTPPTGVRCAGARAAARPGRSGRCRAVSTPRKVRPSTPEKNKRAMFDRDRL
jgi:hypothetical protein